MFDPESKNQKTVARVALFHSYAPIKSPRHAFVAFVLFHQMTSLLLAAGPLDRMSLRNCAHQFRIFGDKQTSNRPLFLSSGPMALHKLLVFSRSSLSTSVSCSVHLFFIFCPSTRLMNPLFLTVPYLPRDNNRPPPDSARNADARFRFGDLPKAIPAVGRLSFR